MKQTPLFCFGSLMDWDVVECVLDQSTVGLTMQPATLSGYRVARLPHESYPMLVADQTRVAHGQLLAGLDAEQLKRIVFFEGEEYVITPCLVQLECGGFANALFFDEGIMPSAELTDWSFNQWIENHKDFMLKQSSAYMSFYGKMTAAEADYYWQTFKDDETELLKLAS